MVERGRPQMTTWRMRISCWIIKTTNAHSQCVTIIAFPQRQWQHERATATIICTFSVLLTLAAHEAVFFEAPKVVTVKTLSSGLRLIEIRLSFSLQNEHHPKPPAPKLQHTTNREQDDRCGNSTTQSQAPDDGYINVPNILST